MQTLLYLLAALGALNVLFWVAVVVLIFVSMLAEPWRAHRNDKAIDRELADIVANARK